MSRSFLADWTPDHYRAVKDQVLLAPHRLHESGLFDDENLIRMLDRHPLYDLGINTMGHDTNHFQWREGDRNGVPSDVLLQLVSRGRLWINMRNVLKHHKDVRDAVDSIYNELELKSPGYKAEQRSANLLISSPGALVHYHLDVPINMLWHMRGVKRVWVYPLTEQLVSQENIEAICSNELAEDLPYDESFDQYATIFDVHPGQMLTWPQNTPHRVTNLDGMNVSLSTEHKNTQAIRLVNVHLANQFLRRKLGITGWSTRVDGLSAHLKQSLTRVLRRFEKLSTKPPRMGNRYPVTFKVDPNAPQGFTLLDAEKQEHAGELVGV
jgi:hypothetical protein